MPTYEYRCKSCSHEFETVQSFTDDALTECPVCHGPLRKVFGNVGISFKGSGFYKTDHGSRAKNGAAAGTSDTKSDNGSSNGSGESATKSDSAKSDSSSSSSSSASSSSTATTPA